MVPTDAANCAMMSGRTRLEEVWQWHSQSMTWRRTSRRTPPKGRIRFHQWLALPPGGSCSASQGLRPGLHSNPRVHGAHQTRVRQARRQDHRDLGPPGRRGKWANDIKETQGFAPNFPMIGSNPILTISKAWGMLPAAASGDASSAPRPTDGAQRVRDRTRQEDQARVGLSDLRRVATSTRRSAPTICSSLPSTRSKPSRT